MARFVLNIPNALTLLRFALVPAIALALLRGDTLLALLLFALSALSDAVDGHLARRWNQRTRFGAVADPLADKLTMLTVGVLLAWLGALPWWFVAAVVGRDGLIVAGALAYHLRFGRVEMAPSVLSKANTGLEFTLLLVVMAIGAGLLPEGPWREALLYLTLATIVASGVHYVVVWGRKALREAG
jgi:cardiolipin synthase